MCAGAAPAQDVDDFGEAALHEAPGDGDRELHGAVAALLADDLQVV